MRACFKEQLAYYDYYCSFNKRLRDDYCSFNKRLNTERGGGVYVRQTCHSHDLKSCPNMRTLGDFISDLLNPTAANSVEHR